MNRKKHFCIVSAFWVLLFAMFSGCNSQQEIASEEYKDYICYDYHLSCLDAKESKVYSDVKKDDISYRIWYRQPVGADDEQFVCASIRMRSPLAFPDLVVMQNPDHYVDVLKEWTISKVEIYYQNSKKSKQLWEEKEPARTPTAIVGTITEPEVFAELVDFVTNDDYSDKLSLPEGYLLETYRNDDILRLYIRVHFKESITIVWESTIDCYVSQQNPLRYIAIDKGREPVGLASMNSRTVLINDLGKLTAAISEQIDKLAKP